MRQRVLCLKIFLFILSVIPLGKLQSLFAQQEPHFTQNMFNYSFINPGHYGLSDAICVTGLYREQWVGFKDEDGNNVRPRTLAVTLDSPIRVLHGGVGLAILQDQLAFFKDVGVRLGYSYHLPIGSGKLGIGANVSFLSKSTDFSKFIPVDEGDPSIASGTAKGIMFTDFSIGAFYNAQNFYASFSSTQMLETEKSLNNEGTNNSYYKLRRHFFLGSGYSFPWKGNPAYMVTPSALLTTDGSSLQVDFNAMLTINQKVWTGVGYRLNESASLMVGWMIKDFDIGYSYDIPMSRVAVTGSHEIMVRYRFKIEREKTKSGYRNTRFL